MSDYYIKKKIKEKNNIKTVNKPELLQELTEQRSRVELKTFTGVEDINVYIILNLPDQYYYKFI